MVQNTQSIKYIKNICGLIHLSFRPYMTLHDITTISPRRTLQGISESPLGSAPRKIRQHLQLRAPARLRRVFSELRWVWRFQLAKLTDPTDLLLQNLSHDARPVMQIQLGAQMKDEEQAVVQELLDPEQAELRRRGSLHRSPHQTVAPTGHRVFATVASYRIAS